jgi:hypothetical protein
MDVYGWWIKHPTSGLVEWWEKNRQESEKDLDAFVDAHPNYWAVAALTKTFMDVGALSVDVLRFGEGAAEFHETGKIAPLIQDAFRGLSIAGAVGEAGQIARLRVGTKLKLYKDAGGDICAPLATGNALRRTGQRILLSLDEIAKAHGFKDLFSLDKAGGAAMEETIAALEKLGARFKTIDRAESMAKLAGEASKDEGVVMFRLTTREFDPKVGRIVDGEGHRVFFEKIGGKVRIVDRTGFYDSLRDLSQRYGVVFAVDSSAKAIFISKVSVKFLQGIPTLMYAANAIIKLAGNTTVPELNKKFQAFKAARNGSNGAPIAGGGKITVAAGDTLSELAKRHYGSSELWPLLWDTNQAAIGSNPNHLRSGVTLQIPPLPSFTPSQIADAHRRSPGWRNY